MLAGISRYVRQHHIALLALFIAFGGTAWAAATINSKDVVDNSLKSVDLKDGKGVKAADVAPGELVAPGSQAWQEVAFFSGGFYCFWSNYGNGFNPAAYYRDPAGVVHLRGVIKAADGQGSACGDVPQQDATVFPGPLIDGYRPANSELFTISSNNKPARLDVTAGGQLRVQAPTYPTWADAKVWVSLDGVSYRCAPSGQNGCP